MNVILISGRARHGKDTVANFLKTLCEMNGMRVVTAHYADYLKFVLKTYFGWDGKKDDAGRTMLQYVGTDVVRKREPDFWARILCDTIRVFDGDWDVVIVPDCRFPNEVTVPKEYGFNVIHMRVERPNFDNGLTEEQNEHSSETALDSVAPDVLIWNRGTLVDLAETVTAWFYKTFAHQDDLLKDEAEMEEIHEVRF